MIRVGTKIYSGTVNKHGTIEEIIGNDIVLRDVDGFIYPIKREDVTIVYMY